jgi:hypothetical protein
MVSLRHGKPRPACGKLLSEPYFVNSKPYITNDIPYITNDKPYITNLGAVHCQSH